MTLITKGMGIIMKGARKKLSVSPKASLAAWKDKAISTIESPRRKSYKKKFGKEPTVTIKHIDGKKETIIDQMIGDREIEIYNRIIKSKGKKNRKGKK